MTRIGLQSLTMAATLAAAGCGSGSSLSGPSGNEAYSFGTPTVGASGTVAVTIVDNSGNTINLTQTSTVLSINPDGSFVTLTEEPAGSVIVVDGTTWSTPPTTHTLNHFDQELSYFYTSATTGLVVNCAYDPHGLGPDGPLQVGQTWTLTFTAGCGTSTPITYTQTGSIVDVESVTVPAGTYMALKLQSTVTWTATDGGSRTETITNWRATNGLGSVKQEIAYAYGAPLPTTGYPVSRVIVLQ